MKEFKIENYTVRVAESLLLPDHKEMLNKAEQQKRGKISAGDVLWWMLPKVIVNVKDGKGNDVNVMDFIYSIRANEAEPLLRHAMMILINDAGIYNLDELKKK